MPLAARRHLNTAAKREMIAAQLRETPERSDRAIAGMFGCDNKTVASVRAELAQREEIPHVEKREDTKGRKQPAKKPATPKPSSTAFVDDTDEGEKEALDRAKVGSVPNIGPGFDPLSCSGCRQCG